ncbi:MAG: DUF63 family protein [Candidatus Micrarchaeota archaeon]|nr:DUF63 family protein [Candidatus Micrarchaeota archaeon]
MDAGEWIAGFVREHFVNPLQYPDKYAPYNAVNTVVYAAVALAAVYLIFKGLKRLGIRINDGFYFAIAPFVVFGAAVRVVVDAGILPRSMELFGQTVYPFVTPGIYFVIFAVVVAGIFASLALDGQRGKKAVWWLRAIGTVFALAALAVVAPLLKFFPHGILIVLLGLLGLGALMAVEKFWKRKFSLIERFTAFSQCFDGAATFVGVGIGTPAAAYGEQHVVGNLLIGAFGNPLAFYAVKVAFALAVVLFLRTQYSERKGGELEEKNYILLLITIFGLAPGARDALRIVAGV